MKKILKIIQSTTLWILTAVLVFSFVTPSSANAAEPTQASECDEDFYASNSVLFFNPCEQACSAGGGAAAGEISVLRGSNNGEKIYNFWVDAGMSPQQAAGITGSMQHEGGFSPFRQENSKTFPAGGWGIAQFTFDPGQRGSVIAYLKEKIGVPLFEQYYKDEYGGPVEEANGFIPPGVPADVNDKFLLGELNYLVQHIRELQPNNIRRDAYSSDFQKTIPESTTLYEYLKTLPQPADSAIAWTYLYEFPGNIKETSIARGESANQIMSMYSGGTGAGTSCGGSLTAGGMDLAKAVAFMEKYKTSADSVNFIGGAGQDCAGGPLSNCVSFSVFFANKYTNIQGMGAGTTPGNGSTVAANIISRNPTIKSGNTPRPYAIFSTASGSMMCGDVKCGHTGVILGIDTARGKVIVGEAGCGAGLEWDTAREYELSAFDSPEYTYAYTDDLLKGAIE